MSKITVHSNQRNVRDFLTNVIAKNYEAHSRTHSKLLSYSVLGNVLYLLLHDEPKDLKYISVIKCWKDESQFTCEQYLDEEQPPHYDCAERMLKEANSTNGGAQQWYAENRTHKAKKKEIRKIIETLKKDTQAVGKTVLLEQTGREVEFCRIYDNNSFLAKCKDKERVFKWHISLVTVEQWRTLLDHQDTTNHVA